MFFNLKDVPVQDGRLWSTRQAALESPKGDIEHCHCPDCSHVFNRAYDPAKVVFDASYDISLHYSPAYQLFIEEVVSHLVNAYDVRQKTVVEIGCGKADFLKSICRAGNNLGVGFDPTFVDGSLNGDARRISIIRDLFDDRYAHVHGDLVCGRSMLQYFSQPREFLSRVRRACNGAHSVTYFEVPNAAHTLEKFCIWNMVYEHANFYSQASLARLFSESGFDVLDVRTCFVEDQNLGIDARPTQFKRGVMPNLGSTIESVNRSIDLFTQEHQRKTTYWKKELANIRSQGKKLLLWGAGARAISFVTLFNQTHEEIPYVVDINPKRQGCYLPLTGQRVISPSDVMEINPDIVLCTNSGYAREIEAQLRSTGSRAEFRVLE